ncbi:MAG TPA: prolipoprotein diacylglyceryl transferase family protein [Anaerolineae bacterium]|nr:prolipoprotein diacylglyceryl transferase family protein [Anaerolineae bacterium]
MLPVLHLGPFTIPVAPLTWLAAFFVVQEIGDRAAKRLKLPKDVFSSALTLAFLVGVIAARLGYVARYLEEYITDPLQIIALNFGTLDLLSGALFGFLAGIAYLQRKKISLRVCGDVLAPALALAFAVVSLGNLLTGDAYGVAAPNLPWAIVLWGELRHPVQVYELAAYAAIFVFVWFRAPRPFDGAHFLVTIALLASVRVLLEPLRGDSVAWVMGLRLGQVAALGVMTGALFLFMMVIQRTARVAKSVG